MSEQEHNDIQWVFDPSDSQAHVVADSVTGESGVLFLMCGRELPAQDTPTYSVAPTLSVCPLCKPFSQVERPPPVFPTPMVY